MKNPILIIVFALISVTSCTKVIEDIVPGINCYDDDLERLSVAADNYNDALIAYNDNPTDGNCQSVKRTGETYINELEAWADCWAAYYPDDDYEAELDEARQDLRDSDCD